MKYIILTTLLLIAGLILSMFIRLGAFHDVTLQVTDDGPFKVVYKAHVGAYDKIVPVIQEVEKWAKAHGESCRFSFGEYIDDPKNSVEDRMRSNGGCVVEKAWTQKELPADFLYREISRRRYVKAQFDGAPSIGPFKVYPKAKKYIKEQDLHQNGPVIEMYEVLPGEKVNTRYFFPVQS